MKKNRLGLFFICLIWTFLFSFAAEASTFANGGVRETAGNKVMTNKATEEKAALGQAEKLEAAGITTESLLQYVQELEEGLKTEENGVAEQIGSLTLTEGIGKKRTKLFSGSRKLLGSGGKEDRVDLVLFYLPAKEDDKTEPMILQIDQYTIGASKLFSAEIELNRVGVNYLLIQVGGENQKLSYQLYQIIVEDIKTKDKLESMTLKFKK